MQFDHRRAGGALLRAAGPIAVAVAVQSAGNLAFHALVGRLLEPAAYGALGALLAAMVMLGIPLGALQTAASAHAAASGAGRATTIGTLRAVTLWSLPAGVLTLLCAPLLSDWFHLDGMAGSAQLGPYLMVAALLATARGLLLGTRRITAVAGTYLIATAVRLILGVALALPFGVTGALAATLLSEVAALAAAVRVLVRDREPGAGTTLRLGAVGGAAVAVTGLFLFSTVDLLLARHHLAGAESGAYVAAATVAKTVLALPAAIMAAVFPRLVAAYDRPGRARTLLTACAAVAGPALVGAAVVAVVPALVLTVLYGDGYSGATTLVQVLSGVAGVTSLVTVLTNAALARHSWMTLVPWAGAVLEIVLIQLWHGSAAQIAACSAAALLPTLLVIAVAEGRAWTRRTPVLQGVRA
ncbi:lipopolysaccharide biosynthesis protein [Actinoplanes sichuanensis]|uniref:Lipopolysaccharide biosynthesis protein n=1 Tax=Actinoplanes sichuanensis TaxID=512349 RepID=A0ABW3ZZR7_9ACTN|nr:polysaccharide biosynthesis protein [Actinoplanes sichuanensis]